MNHFDLTQKVRMYYVSIYEVKTGAITKKKGPRLGLQIVVL